MFNRTRQSYSLGCNATLSNPEYAEIWRKMRLCWAPCLGHQPQRTENLAGFGGVGVPTSNVTFTDGYPFRVANIGTAINHTEGVQMTSSNGSLNLTNGYVCEAFFFINVDNIGSTNFLYDINFGAAGGAGTLSYRTNTGVVQAARVTQASATIDTTLINKWMHTIEVCPNRNINTTVSHRLSVMTHPNGRFATGVGNFATALNLTYGNFASVTMGNRAALTLGYPALWSFFCIYEYESGYELARFALKRMRDPFGLFGLSQRPMGRASNLSTFLPGRPFPSLPFPILAM